MVNGGKATEEEQLPVKDKRIENITEFVNFGSLLTEDNDWSREVQRRIATATGAMEQFGEIWRNKNIINILKATVMSVRSNVSKRNLDAKEKNRDRLL